MPSSCAMSIFSLDDNKFRTSICIINFQPVTMNTKLQTHTARVVLFRNFVPNKRRRFKKKSMNEKKEGENIER